MDREISRPWNQANFLLTFLRDEMAASQTGDLGWWFLLNFFSPIPLNIPVPTKYKEFTPSFLVASLIKESSTEINLIVKLAQDFQKRGSYLNTPLPCSFCMVTIRIKGF